MVSIKPLERPQTHQETPSIQTLLGKHTQNIHTSNANRRQQKTAAADLKPVLIRPLESRAYCSRDSTP